METLPTGSGDLVFLFTKSGGTHSTARDINPRQSFQWVGETRTIRPFKTVAEIYECLDIAAAGYSRNSEIIQNSVKRLNGIYEALQLHSSLSPVTVYASRCNAQNLPIRRKLLSILPFLELYRGSTLHSLNDTQQARYEDLIHFVPQMSASPKITACRMLKHFADHPRFGVHAYALLERGTDTKWSAILATDKPTGQIAEDLITAGDLEVLASRKVLGIAHEQLSTIFIPFTRVIPYIRFDHDEHTEEYAAQVSHEAPSLHPGDLVLALVFAGSNARAGVINSILYYRQYYYETFYPALLADLRRILFEKTSAIESMIRNAPREERSSDPWTPFKEVCDTILPTLGKALGVCISVRLFDISTGTLKRVSNWDLPGTIRVQEIARTDLISLRKGERGINATTFNDVARSFIYVDDINKLKSKAGYIEHRSTTISQYCHKIFFRSIPIGTINFESPRVDGIPVHVQRQLSPFIEGLQNYLREFLLAQDSDWLSLTAAAYHNLHELRQTAEAVNTVRSEAVLQAISGFDQASDPQSVPLANFQDFLNAEIPAKLEKVPAFAKRSIEQSARMRCHFDVVSITGLRIHLLSGSRFELLKRIFRNLIANFPISATEESYDTFSVVAVEKPMPSVHFRQVQSKPFDEKFLRGIGFRPLTQGPGDRLHHGLFLCSAIARFLGGYSWIGNRHYPDLGVRSIVQIVVPLKEHRQHESRLERTAARSHDRFVA